MNPRRFQSLAALLLLAAVLFVALGCPQSPPPGAIHGPAAVVPDPKASPEELAVRRLLRLMRDRLLLMNEVARSKWAHKRQITDPQRELAQLNGLVERGKANGLDPQATRRFFAAQIEAAKLIQEAWFDLWRTTNQGPVVEAVSELSELRQRIDPINQELLKALADAQPWLSQKTGWEALLAWAHQDLVGTGIDDVVRSTALAPLGEKKSDLPPGFRRN